MGRGSVAKGAPALLCGESGTGKSFIAHKIHGGRGKKVTRKASVLLYVKVVNAETGVVAWSRSATGTLSWTGWPEKCSEMSPSDFLEKALTKALKEIRAVFPHRKRVRERIM